MTGGDDTNNQSKIDPSSPYFLGSQDGPGVKITKVEFRGDNYEAWSRSIRLSLRARRKYGFIEGTIPKPTSASKLEDWTCVQSTIVQWLLMTIHDSVLNTLPFYEEAKPLWDALKRRFDVGNGPRRQQLKAALTACKQSKTMTVAEYFGLLQPLWDELATYNPPPLCKCGKCTCDLGELYQARLDEDRLHDFFFGINDELFGTVRSTLLAQDPPPTLDRAYQAFLQQERLCSATPAKAERDDVMALALKSLPSTSRASRPFDTRNNENRGKACPVCNRTGHVEENCFFKKNEWPEWWGDRPRCRAPGKSSTPTSRGAAGSSGVAAKGIRAEVHAVGGGTMTEHLQWEQLNIATGQNMSPVQWQQLINVVGNVKPPDEL